MAGARIWSRGGAEVARRARFVHREVILDRFRMTCEKASTKAQVEELQPMDASRGRSRKWREQSMSEQADLFEPQWMGQSEGQERQPVTMAKGDADDHVTGGVDSPGIKEDGITEQGDDVAEDQDNKIGGRRQSKRARVSRHIEGCIPS